MTFAYTKVANSAEACLLQPFKNSLLNPILDKNCNEDAVLILLFGQISDIVKTLISIIPFDRLPLESFALKPEIPHYAGICGSFIHTFQILCLG